MKTRQKFELNIIAGDYFTIEELWPDGDAPENPTIEDVKKLIEECGGIKRIINDWGLDISYEVWEVK